MNIHGQKPNGIELMPDWRKAARFGVRKSFPQLPPDRKNKQGMIGA
jgi:hypothetical protein